jgi:hypothetical protein
MNNIMNNMLQLITKLKKLTTNKLQPITFVGVLLVAGYCLLAVGVNAQTNSAQIILTWQAQNFYPADYPLKPLPTVRSAVVVSAEIVKNGKLADSSQTVFTWYIEDNFFDRGSGLNSILFTASQNDYKKNFVKVEAVYGDERLERTISIPITNPKIILNVPAPNREIFPNTKIDIQAIPYFFNVTSITDLIFSWQINGVRQNARGNDIALEIGTPQNAEQKTLNITATTQNRNDVLEITKNNLSLTIR